MTNPTANLSMTKPTVGGSTDTWGTTINENVVDIIDALFSISGTDVTMSDIKFNSVGLQETGSGTDTVKIQAPSAVTQYTLTMPGAVGSTNQVLSASDGSGTLAWTSPEVGDITSVADATNGGMTVTNGTGPDVTLAVNFNDLSAATVNVTTDSIAILDADDSGTKKESIADLVAGMSGTGITNASGVLGVAASQTQVTALGTVVTGTWSADTVAVNKGGTGLASYAAGDVIYASGATTLAKLAKGSDTEVLTLASGVPTWAAPTVGDITGVTAGTGLSGGGTSGTVTLNVEAAQTQITSVGALAAGSISSGFGAIDVGSSSIDGGTITGTFSGNITGNVTGNCSGTAGSATGNAATATALQTARTIGGTSFDGTANIAVALSATTTALATARAINGTDFDGTAAITVTAAASTLTGTELKSTVVTSSLTAVGTLASLGVGDITSTGNFTTSDTGPHAVGIASADYIQWVQGGAFTSGGATTRAGAFVVRTVLTGADGDTAVQCAIGAGNTWGTAITTQANSETIGVVATAHFSDPDITKGTDTVTTAATVYIAGAPSEGEENAALWIADGNMITAGHVICGPNALTGVGYNSASYPLTVAFSGAAHQGAGWYDNTTDGSSRYSVYFNRYPSSSWATVGSISTGDSSTAFNTSSDYRLKENETPFGDALDLLGQLKPYKFNFKIHDESQITHGFFAHEAAGIVPQAVTGEKDAVDDDDKIIAQSIDHSHMVPLLVAAIQELAAKVEVLENA